MKCKDLPGMKFGKLTVTDEFVTVKTRTGQYKKVKCICECGSEVYVMTANIGRRSHTQGCGKCSVNTFIELGDYYIGYTSSGYVFLFDKCDYALVSKYTWHMTRKYLRTLIDGKTVSMHRLILGEIPEGLETDHINRKPFDNRRRNLRLATRQENCANRGYYTKKKKEEPHEPSNHI